MGVLEGKKVILGVTGGIAAYKAAVLCRLLVREGAQVKVIMTRTAKEFITPLTMATLSRNPVPVEFFNPENGEWNSHVSLGMWADLLLIAPATADTVARMACGIADNLLLTTVLSARCPVMIAPAMDLDMYAHPATVENIRTLRSRGVKVVEAVSGELASGLSGKGRMAEPEAILEAVAGFIAEGNGGDSASGHARSALAGHRVLITAGPTVEAIDPVRFISNHSSGKMGYALARSFASSGAEVVLVSGPVSLPAPGGVRRINVTSAVSMHDAFMEEYSKGCDVAVFCAAVADYRPERTATSKIKRDGGVMTLTLVPNPDIAALAGGVKRPGAVHVGFALETDDELKNASAKLERKNLDMVVMNSLKVKGSCFGTDTNQVTLIRRGREPELLPMADKSEIADRITSAVMEMLNA